MSCSSWVCRSSVLLSCCPSYLVSSLVVVVVGDCSGFRACIRVMSCEVV